jgi:hypothetical protein
MEGRAIFLVLALYAVLVTVADVLLTHAVVLTTLTRRDHLRGAGELPDVTFYVTISLVFAPLAVGRAVADPALEDASTVLARILIVIALAVVVADVTAVLLILAAVTILLLVALPSQRNAATVIALELIRGAADGSLRAVLLVTPIAAVVVAIAAEALKDAAAAGTSHPTERALALELPLGTVWQRKVAVQLVTVVLAILLAIAFKRQRYAAIIQALELVVRTSETGKESSSSSSSMMYPLESDEREKM